MHLATEKFVPKSREKVSESGRNVTPGGSWDKFLCGHWVKPVGSTGGDQSQANGTTVPHRTENFPFSTVKVFIHIVNGCIVRAHGLAEFSDVLWIF